MDKLRELIDKAIIWSNYEHSAKGVEVGAQLELVVLCNDLDTENTYLIDEDGYIYRRGDE